MDFCLGWPHICQATCSRSGNRVIVPIYLAVVGSASIIRSYPCWWQFRGEVGVHTDRAGMRGATGLVGAGGRGHSDGG